MSTRRVLLALLIVVTVIGSVIPVGLAEDLPRHRDPLDFGPEQPDLVSLENLYGFIFNRTLTENFPLALHWLDVAGLVFAPQTTKVVMDRFTTLFRSEIGDLNLTKADIEMIRGYVRHLKWDDAKLAVAAALARLDVANATVGDMDLTAIQLAVILKGSPASMLGGDEGLRGLIEKYREELLALLKQAEESGNPPTLPDGTVLPPDAVFIRTKILISVTPVEALVGSSVLVSGNLTDMSGVGLASRRVHVFIDNDLVGWADTDGSGSFTLTLGVPYVYKDHITVSAEYLGEIVGSSVYLPCSSNDVVVKLIYYTPVISVDLPRTVYPGRVFNVSGSVQYGGVGVGGLDVEFFAFNGVVHLVSDGGGLFSVAVSVPPDSPEGLTGVGVYSSPREVYGPSDFIGYVNVVRVPLTLSVDSSSWAISGLPFRVSGSVLLDGVPVGNCTVRLGGSVGDSVVTTGLDGRFESEVGLPFSLFTADYPFNVKAYAPKPWIGDSSIGGRVFIVNAVTLIAGPVLIGGGVYYASKRFRRPRRRVAVSPLVEDGPVPVPVAEAEAEVGPGTVRGAYGSALELVVKKTGVTPKPSQTLREYLDATKGGLGAGARVFRSLTLMFERWLYGGSEVRVGVVERLLRRIRELFS